jgi:nucleotide-binding universal stress UspA family protein
LDRYRTVIEAAGFDVETHVVRRTPYRRINGIAEAVRADVSIVGSRGESPLENRIIGSTARTLARMMVVPLLVTRVERGTDDPAVRRERLFHRLLFATDFSEHADRAFDAFWYLRRTVEPATLVHVRSPKDGGRRRRPTRAAGRARTNARGVGYRHRDCVRTDEILDVEAAVTPPTTLVGATGRSRIRRLLPGSVSEEVVARAAGNVFLVPPPRAA